MTPEQKAKRFDEALERARIWKDKSGMPKDRQGILDDIFPELKENDSEKIRKEPIDFVKSRLAGFPECDRFIAWLGKQGEIDKESYKIDEKEKREFVGDGFIKCYADFQDFKEGETYWLEYIGDDKYNVRSDNLLGKTYHITPCQLYTVFKKLTWLEKQGEPNPYSGVSFKYDGHTWGMCARDGGVHILIDSNLKAFVSLDKSFIYPIHPQPIIVPQPAREADEEKVVNQNCVEPIDNIEPKFKVGDTMRTLQEVSNGITSGLPVVVSIDNEYYRCNNETIAIKDQNNYEYPPINKKHDAWSEEDKNLLNRLIGVLDGTNKEDYHEAWEEKFLPWLKSLKKRMNNN